MGPRLSPIFVCVIQTEGRINQGGGFGVYQVITENYGT